jgi:hypothetical protein
MLAHSPLARARRDPFVPGQPPTDGSTARLVRLSRRLSSNTLRDHITSSGGQLALPLLAVLAAGAATATLVTPWLRTGTVTRSAIDLVSALHQAGLLGIPGARAFSAVTIAGPAVLAGAVMALALDSPRLASALAGGSGLLVGGAAATVIAEAPGRAVGGALAAIVAASVTVLAALCSLLSSRSPSGHHKGEPKHG